MGTLLRPTWNKRPTEQRCSVVPAGPVSNGGSCSVTFVLEKISCSVPLTYEIDALSRRHWRRAEGISEGILALFLLEISRMQSRLPGRDGRNLHKEPRASWERMNLRPNTLGLNTCFQTCKLAGQMEIVSIFPRDNKIWEYKADYSNKTFIFYLNYF